MKYKAHSYQTRATQFILEHPYCALLLDMGLGKTVSTMTALDILMYQTIEVSRVLVIAPKSVALNTWSGEAAKWDHLNHMRLSLVLGTPKQRVKALEATADLYVTNCDNVVWLVEHYAKAGQRWPFDCVVLDESSRFKNYQAKRYKALYKVRPYIRRLIELTGTPSPNGLEDLWSQIRLLDHGDRLGRYITGFRREYMTPGAHNGNTVYQWVPVKGAKEKIASKISDITISMQAADYLEMPMLIDAGMTLRLPELQAYEDFQRECLLEVDGEQIEAMSAAALTNKLLQFASGAVYDGEHDWHEVSTAKLEALTDLVESLDEPAMVMYNYRHELERITRALPDAVPFRGEPELLAAWNRGEIRVLLCHPASVSFGLNLQQGGRVIIWYSPTYNLEQYEQANARLYRQGQTKPVLRYHLSCIGTMDEVVVRALQGKADMQQTLIKSLKAMRYETIGLGQ